MKKNHPILVVIPHSSIFVPPNLRQALLVSNLDIKKHADLATDKIFDIPQTYTAKAKISRLVIDPNRAPDDIEMEYRLGHQGVVVSVTEEGKPIYKNPPTIETISKRVEKYHDKFHEEINKLIPKVKFLIDGHSMKSVGPAMKIDAGKKRVDIILGNREYTTCSREMTLKFKHFFEKRNLKVSINKPYKGKYILGCHCSRKGLPGIQIEINRKLYMNEKTLQVSNKKVKTLNTMMCELVEWLASEL